MDDDLLLLLLRIPFLSLANAADFLDAPHATINHTARRLREQGLVERVPIGGNKTMLHCLTEDGVAVIARAYELDPNILAATY